MNLSQNRSQQCECARRQCGNPRDTHCSKAVRCIANRFWDRFMYETAWKRRGVGTQAPARRGVVAEGTWSSRGGSEGGSHAGGRGRVERSIREEWRGGPGGQAASRAHSQTLVCPAQEAAGALDERTAGPRLSHRSVDPAASGRGDPPAVRRSLRPVACVAYSEQLGLECAEARTAGPRARPRRHRVGAGGIGRV